MTWPAWCCPRCGATSLDDTGTGTAQVYAGDDFELPMFRALDATGAGFDFTGWTIRSQMRHLSESTEVLATFTVTPADQTDLDTRGHFTLTLAHDITQPLPAGWHVFDVELTDPDGKRTTWLRERPVLIIGDVTRT